MAPFAARYVELAAKRPNAPIAISALRQAIQAIGTTDSAGMTAWETNEAEFPAGTNLDLPKKLIALLERDHLKSPKLRVAIDRARYNYRLEFGPFLQTAMESTPHRDVKALATLFLAMFLTDRLQMLQLADDRPDMVDRYNALFGPDYLPGLRKLKNGDAIQRIEQLLQRATQYTDVKSPFGDTIAERAERALYEFRHLRIGKPSPEITGVDQSDKPFKLSDYHDKVVLLYFWSDL